MPEFGELGKEALEKGAEVMLKMEAAVEGASKSFAGMEKALENLRGMINETTVGFKVEKFGKRKVKLNIYKKEQLELEEEILSYLGNDEF